VAEIDPLVFARRQHLTPGLKVGSLAVRVNRPPPSHYRDIPRQSSIVGGQSPKPYTGATREAALTDQKLIIFTLKDAHRIIAEHLDFGRTRDPEETVTRLIRTLNRPEIARAIERLQGEHRLRLVE
jgi:hypothetical protein